MTISMPFQAKMRVRLAWVSSEAAAKPRLSSGYFTDQGRSGEDCGICASNPYQRHIAVHQMTGR